MVAFDSNSGRRLVAGSASRADSLLSISAVWPGSGSTARIGRAAETDRSDSTFGSGEQTPVEFHLTPIGTSFLTSRRELPHRAARWVQQIWGSYSGIIQPVGISLRRRRDLHRQPWTLTFEPVACSRPSENASHESGSGSGGVSPPNGGRVSDAVRHAAASPAPFRPTSSVTPISATPPNVSASTAPTGLSGAGSSTSQMESAPGQGPRAASAARST